MNRFAVRAALVAASMVALQAQATNVQITGTITQVYSSGIAAPAVGETIAASYSYTNTSTYYSGGDGSSYAYGYSNGSVAGNLWTSGGSVISLNGSLYSNVYQSVYRNYYGYYNEASTEVVAEQYDNNNGVYGYGIVDLETYDYNGATSTLFTDPNGGLSFNQGINAAGAYQTGFFEEETNSGYYYGYFTPTSLTISSVPEPANIALLLAGVGLVGLRARRRQAAQA